MTRRKGVYRLPSLSDRVQKWDKKLNPEDYAKFLLATKDLARELFTNYQAIEEYILKKIKPIVDKYGHEAQRFNTYVWFALSCWYYTQRYKDKALKMMIDLNYLYWSAMGLNTQLLKEIACSIAICPDNIENIIENYLHYKISKGVEFVSKEIVTELENIFRNIATLEILNNYLINKNNILFNINPSILDSKDILELFNRFLKIEGDIENIEIVDINPINVILNKSVINFVRFYVFPEKAIRIYIKPSGSVKISNKFQSIFNGVFIQNLFTFYTTSDDISLNLNSDVFSSSNDLKLTSNILQYLSFISSSYQITIKNNNSNTSNYVDIPLISSILIDNNNFNYLSIFDTNINFNVSSETTSSVSLLVNILDIVRISRSINLSIEVSGYFNNNNINVDEYLSILVPSAYNIATLSNIVNLYNNTIDLSNYYIPYFYDNISFNINKHFCTGLINRLTSLILSIFSMCFSGSYQGYINICIYCTNYRNYVLNCKRIKIKPSASSETEIITTNKAMKSFKIKKLKVVNNNDNNLDFYFYDYFGQKHNLLTVYTNETLETSIDFPIPNLYCYNYSSETNAEIEVYYCEENELLI